jgi:predicted metalloprotease
MKYKGRKQSSNIEDRRGGGTSRAKKGLLGGGGIIGIVVAIAVAYFSGGDIGSALTEGAGQIINNQTQQTTQPITETAESTDRKEFISVVLKDTEDFWSKKFNEMGKTYHEPALVLFTGNVKTDGCGSATAASGPFYCPADQKVYIDMSFYDVLSNRLGAKGDFAMAYVIAHEVGHHVQNLLGLSTQMQQARQQLSKTEFNKLSVKQELQADFYAGMFAEYEKNNKQVLDYGDIDEAIATAKQIGDDMLQMKSQGKVVPHTFTHGTSEQRMRWFRKGFDAKNINEGDTFRALRL